MIGCSSAIRRQAIHKPDPWCTLFLQDCREWTRNRIPSSCQNPVLVSCTKSPSLFEVSTSLLFRLSLLPDDFFLHLHFAQDTCFRVDLFGDLKSTLCSSPKMSFFCEDKGHPFLEFLSTSRSNFELLCSFPDIWTKVPPYYKEHFEDF